MFRSSPRVSFPRVALQKLRLLLALLFFVHGFWGPGPWLLCFTGSRVPSLAVSLSSRPFGTCFNQPTMHPLGLIASVVHDHCTRRRGGHRINNLLKTLDVKGSQHPPLRRALCLRKHKLHLVTRLVDIHTLELMCAGVPTITSLLFTVFYSHSLNSSAPACSRAIPRSTYPSKSRQSRLPSHASGTHTGPPHKIGTTISQTQPGHPLLCRCTKSAAHPQYL